MSDVLESWAVIADNWRSFDDGKLDELAHEVSAAISVIRAAQAKALRRLVDLGVDLRA